MASVANVAILAGILSILGRFAGQLLNLTLGWATLLLFGKVPQRKQFILLIIVFGSLVWVALVLGVLVPSIGTFVVAAVPRPDFVPEEPIRWGMLAGALIVPLAIGAAAVYVTEAASRPRGANLIVSVLRGYPFAAVLTLILVVLVLVASGRKIRSMARRWEDTHVPVIVKPGKYEEVLAVLRKELAAADLALEPRDAGLFISGPPKLLDLIAGRALGDLVPDRLQLLIGQNLEILVYPSDLAISGTRALVARARAAIISKLIEAPAYMTTSAEAQKLEDELERLGAGAWELRPQELVRHVRSLDAPLATLAVAFEEWETLYRMRLQLERDALVAMTEGRVPRDFGADAEGAPAVEAPVLGPRRASRLDLAIGLAGAALVALDLVVLVGTRRRRSEGEPGSQN